MANMQKQRNRVTSQLRPTDNNKLTGAGNAQGLQRSLGEINQMSLSDPKHSNLRDSRLNNFGDSTLNQLDLSMGNKKNL